MLNPRKFFLHYPLVTVVLLLVILGFIVYFLVEKIPFTDNAFVVAKIRPVSCQVAGYVEKIYVENNQYVKKGTKLFSIEKDTYTYAVNRTQAEKIRAIHTKNSLISQISKDETSIKRQVVLFKTARFNANNASYLASTNAAPRATAENLIRNMEAHKLAITLAQKDIEITRHNLKANLEQIKALSNQLKIAKYNLAQTTVYAKSDGHTSNLNLAIGTYVKKGQPLFSYVDTNKWWVQANLKETDLTHVRRGQRANIWLRMYPDHIFHGVVTHMGWAANRQLTARENFLPVVKKENQWFLLPQRFPVRVRLIDVNQKKYPLHIGATAYIRIIT